MIYIFIIIICITGLLTLAYMRFEAGFVELKKIGFTDKKDALRVLHLSDIHIPHLKVSATKVRDLIDKVRPDLIVMTGDYLIKPSQVPMFYSFLDTIKGDYKIFLCFGNHDHKAFRRNHSEFIKFEEGIANKGISVLSNRSEVFVKGARRFNIIGIDDIRYNRHDIDRALSSRSSDCAVDIVIVHNPDAVLELPNHAVNYLFCGHFHGGQIWAPFNFEFLLLRKDRLPKMGIRRGLHKINGIHVYINRGLGNVSIPLRLFSRPEITVYHL